RWSPAPCARSFARRAFSSRFGVRAVPTQVAGDHLAPHAPGRLPFFQSSESAACRARLRFFGFVDRGGAAGVAAADKLLVERHTLLAEGTLVRVVGREVAAHQTEHGAGVEGDRRAAP